MPGRPVRRRRWIAQSQPYLWWSWGRLWLGYTVRLADDVALTLRRRMWTCKRRGKR